MDQGSLGYVIEKEGGGVGGMGIKEGIGVE